MRLFKSSNKSQASLDRLTGSRDHSPTQQSESAYPQGQSYGGPPPPVAYPPPQFQDHQQQQQQPQQQQQLVEERHYVEVQGQQHPAHALSRAQSNRVASGAGEVYVQEQRPTVNIVPPSNGSAPQGRFVPGQTQFGQSQTVRTEKEHKKSKRSIFGFSKDKKEDKEESDRRALGRSGSVLRKGSQQQAVQPTSPRQQQAPQYTDPRQAVQAEARSSENLPEDPEHYEQYYAKQGQYRQQDQYDSPQSQHTRESFQKYAEDPHFQQQQQQQQPHHAQQDQQYQAYRLSNSANSSDNQLPRQEPRFSAATYDHSQGLRPPSQNSLGPPSPLPSQTVQDSRPSTSNTQQRYSTQSQQQQQQQQQIYQQPQDQQQTTISSSQSSTPQPPSAQSDQPSQQLVSQLVQQSSTVSAMGRNDNDNANGRRHEAHMYAQQDPRVRAQANEQNSQGRNTPPPNRAREDLSQLDFHQLLAKHEELQAKYSKVKRYYFEREAQVTQLQNTVANQRLSMSKTSLDDAGYTTRFDRLNGAIQNLAFNIRKDWRRVPNWLTPVCNRDAHSVGTKEMTAVGRACITRWLYEYVFERIFHPGIDPNLSMHLKTIERVLRGAQYVAPLTSEQQDDLLTKITTWRLTTVEGLQDVLSSQQSEAYTESLALHLTRQLEVYLRSFLHDPPPMGLADGLSGIIHQAISILRNVPLESRDICIEYFMPGSHLNESYMKLESGMTPLSQPGSAPTASDLLPVNNDNDETASMPPQIDPNQGMNVEDAIRESAKAASASMQAASSQQPNAGIPPKSAQQNPNASTKDKKGGFLGGFVNKKPAPPATQPNIDQGRSADGSNSLEHGWTLQTLAAGSTEGKIRFAVFLAVEVRGRGVLKENKDSGDKSGTGSSKDLDEVKAGSGGSGGGSAAAGVPKSGNNASMNILCKAPVYAFE